MADDWSVEIMPCWRGKKASNLQIITQIPHIFSRAYFLIGIQFSVQGLEGKPSSSEFLYPLEFPNSFPTTFSNIIYLVPTGL
jgi:hypothetical protein